MKASQLTDFNNAGVLDVLSTCYAAAGNYPKAIEIEEKAILIAKQNNRTDLVTKFTSKLNSLKQKHEGVK